MNEHLKYEDLKDRLHQYFSDPMGVSRFADAFPEVSYYKIGDMIGSKKIVELATFGINLSTIVQMVYLSLDPMEVSIMSLVHFQEHADTNFTPLYKEAANLVEQSLLKED